MFYAPGLVEAADEEVRNLLSIGDSIQERTISRASVAGGRSQPPTEDDSPRIFRAFHSSCLTRRSVTAA